MSNSDEGWKRGIAFVRGINMFDNSRITKEKMVDLCEEVEGEDIRIEKVYGADNVVFEKRGIHYAKVGQKLEEVLSNHFGEPVKVTTRSFRTVKI